MSGLVLLTLAIGAAGRANVHATGIAGGSEPTETWMESRFAAIEQVMEERVAAIERQYSERIRNLEREVASLRNTAGGASTREIDVDASDRPSALTDSRRLTSSATARASVTFDGQKFQYSAGVNVSGTIEGYNIKGNVYNKKYSAFNAKPAAQFSASPGIWIADDVILNVGDDYDSSTGKYTAPMHGIYQFCAMIESDIAGSGVAIRDENDLQHASAYSSSASGTTMTACAVIELNAGDKIHSTCHATTTVHPGSTFFNGVLVTPLE